MPEQDVDAYLPSNGLDAGLESTPTRGPAEIITDDTFEEDDGPPVSPSVVDVKRLAKMKGEQAGRLRTLNARVNQLRNQEQQVWNDVERTQLFSRQVLEAKDRQQLQHSERKRLEKQMQEEEEALRARAREQRRTTLQRRQGILKQKPQEVQELGQQMRRDKERIKQQMADLRKEEATAKSMQVQASRFAKKQYIAGRQGQQLRAEEDRRRQNEGRFIELQEEIQRADGQIARQEQDEMEAVHRLSNSQAQRREQYSELQEIEARPVLEPGSRRAPGFAVLEPGGRKQGLSPRGCRTLSHSPGLGSRQRSLGQIDEQPSRVDSLGTPSPSSARASPKLSSRPRSPGAPASPTSGRNRASPPQRSCSSPQLPAGSKDSPLVAKPPPGTGDSVGALPSSNARAKPGKRLSLGLMLDDDLDEEESLSASWNYTDLTGSMYHVSTGVKVSATSGITADGQTFALTADKIEIDADTRLGSGACGVVQRGRVRATGDTVAIKSIKVNDKPKRDQLLTEIRVLIEVQRCDFLVHWFGGFVAKASGVVHVVLEFMDLGSLRDLLQRLPPAPDSEEPGVVPPRYVATITWQVFMGLEFLHRSQLLHRDVKPENILHDTAGKVKLTDFGISKELDQSKDMATTFMGTQSYMSPERLDGGEYSGAADVWAAGLIVHELASGRYCFGDVLTFPALFEAVVDNPAPPLDPARYPAPLCGFIGRCLEREIDARGPASALLEHDFLSKDVPPREELAEFLGRR